MIKVLIVQTPGLGPKVFLTAPLSLFQWFVCLLAGIGSLICYQVVIFIPTSSPKSDKIPTKRGKHRTMSVEMEKMGEPTYHEGERYQSRVKTTTDDVSTRRIPGRN